jgi:hypothetical protein
MGYGGFFKTVVKVAATAFGAWACGPPCAALGSAVATGATGGSFKESLMAGATTFATASFAQGLSNSITSTAGGFDPLGIEQLTTSTGLPISGASFPSEVISAAGASGLATAPTALQAMARSLIETPLEDVPIVGDLTEGASKFADSAFGMILQLHSRILILVQTFSMKSNLRVLILLDKTLMKLSPVMRLAISTKGSLIVL